MSSGPEPIQRISTARGSTPIEGANVYPPALERTWAMPMVVVEGSQLGRFLRRVTFSSSDLIRWIHRKNCLDSPTGAVLVAINKSPVQKPPVFEGAGGHLTSPRAAEMAGYYRSSLKITEVLQGPADPCSALAKAEETGQPWQEQLLRL